MNARTHRSAPRSRTIRTAKEGAARDAIGTIEPGCELFVLTFGQFSLINALVELIRQTGPAEVVLATWTAAEADLTIAASMLERAAITRMRLIVDHNFMRRPNARKLADAMRQLFGDGCIRTTASHAKFLAIRNAAWTLAVRTSMNLNQNPRLENIEISDDPALCAFLESIADELFREQQPGVFDGSLPLLSGIPGIERSGRVSDIGAVTI